MFTFSLLATVLYVAWETYSHSVAEGSVLDICVVATGQNNSGVVLIDDQYYSGNSGEREVCTFLCSFVSSLTCKLI